MSIKGYQTCESLLRRDAMKCLIVNEHLVRDKQLSGLWHAVYVNGKCGNFHFIAWVTHGSIGILYYIYLFGVIFIYIRYI